MAHWAELDGDDVVVQVIRYDADLDEDGETELDTPPSGLADHSVGTGPWVRTWYGTPPARYAGIGMVWRPDLDNFISAQPFPSWTLDPVSLTWGPPAPIPDYPGLFFDWSEELGVWVPRPPGVVPDPVLSNPDLTNPGLYELGG